MSDAEVKSVAVVGAGISGIGAVKSCVEEGLVPVCYEQFEHVGGVWNYSDDVLPGQGAAVHDTLVTTTSKSMTCFSDHPFDDEAPQYLPHRRVSAYLRAHVDKFNLTQFIKLQHVVEEIRPSPRYEECGSWLVTVRNKTTDVSETREFDGVIVCNGRQQVPIYPSIPGLADFAGEQFHAISYRKANNLRNKKVLIIGNACTAGDLVVEAALVAKTVIFSVGRGTWIRQRLGTDGTSLPLDFTFSRALQWLPLSVANWVLKRKCNALVDHVAHGIASGDNPGPLYTSAMINDKLAGRIKEGSVSVKPHVTHVYKSHVSFSDGSRIDDIDVIMYATGYNLKWDFLSTSVLPSDWAHLDLYRLVWPAHLPHPSLAVVGSCAIRGPATPVLELQARWAAAVMSGRLRLPSAHVMNTEIASRKQSLKDRFGYLKVLLDPVPYQDELVSELGIKPSIVSMLFSCPYDIIRWYFGPAFPMLYRLYGRHSWSGARAAIDKAVANARADQQKAINKRHEVDRKRSE